MSEVVKKPLKITETVLRDAHQSLIATRMTTEQMLPIIPKMDKVGFNAVECWGGATFDACLRFLKEDPWDRLRKLRDGFKNTKLHVPYAVRGWRNETKTNMLTRRRSDERNACDRRMRMRWRRRGRTLYLRFVYQGIMAQNVPAFDVCH